MSNKTEAYDIIEKFRGKRILIWGYGKEGKSTEQFFLRNALAAEVDIYQGDLAGIDEEAYDYIFKSPGIPAENLSEKFTSQTELFLQCFKYRVVGITGTKGKSTTSTMLYHVLKECTDKKVFLLGNIGSPCLDVYEEIDDDTIVVFEMSCHQLANIRISPHVAVLLNLFQEHLDYYGTMEKYVAAKNRIMRYQTEADFAYVGPNVPADFAKSEVRRIPEADEMQIGVLGAHNLYNATVAKRIAVERFGCKEEAVEDSLKEFHGLPHRLEYAGEREGIRFYDDSISTIPEATIQAIESIENVKTVLVGGMDRQIDYTVLIDYMKEHEEVQFICMYESGRRIYETCKDCSNTYYEEDLYRAIDRARAITSSGAACVLSPAAASYGYFENFEDRGNKFKDYVLGR